MVQSLLSSKNNYKRIVQIAEKPGLVLVSGSPRRRQLLAELGIDFEIIIPDIHEAVVPGLIAGEQAVQLAESKVKNIACDGLRIYVGCDTMVILDGEILDKPKDNDDARRILKTLAGNTHSVFTGVALFDSRSNAFFKGFEESRVTFNTFDEARIDAYIATGEPADKAGAYGIQGMGGFLVDTVEGNIDNVIGLPMSTLDRLAGNLLEKYVQQK